MTQAVGNSYLQGDSERIKRQMHGGNVTLYNKMFTLRKKD